MALIFSFLQLELGLEDADAMDEHGVPEFRRFVIYFLRLRCVSPEKAAYFHL